MSLIEQARIDTQNIVSNSLEFGEAVKFTSPLSVSVDLFCLQAKHHTGYDIDTGVRVSNKSASICVSENKLTDLGYVVRDSKNEVSLKNHIVELKDSTGVLQKYVIRETFPDESVGIIVCILGDYISE